MRNRSDLKARPLRLEKLEDRHLMAADALSDLYAAFEAQPEAEAPAHRWQNPAWEIDVNNDGDLTALDALLVINRLNSAGSGPLPSVGDIDAYYDCSGDDHATPLDALIIINALNLIENLSPLESPAPEIDPANLPTGGPLPAPLPSLYDPFADPFQEQMTDGEVELLLARAAAASGSEDFIIAIVDRNGRILGVRTEQNVVNTFGADTFGLSFAIDGAVAKARTAAFFASDQGPLTSRTIRNLSQSTMTQREVTSNPSVPNPLTDNPFDPNSPLATTFGPGFVAPIGIGGHFPQGVNFTPPVDLFAIEHQSRDGLRNPGFDGIKGNGDDAVLTQRFNIDPVFVKPGKSVYAPEAYGVASGRVMQAQSRGIATLPGGIPLYKKSAADGELRMVGGIGVFYPGPNGYATHEQSFIHSSNLAKPQTNEARLNAPRVLEAEWIAYAATGGLLNSPPAGLKFGNGKVGTLGGVAPVPGYGVPAARIDLVGITLEVFGPNPTTSNPLRGLDTVQRKGQQVGQGNANNGVNQIVAPGMTFLDGAAVPEGWLVMPHTTAASSLTAAQVEQIILAARNEAILDRAAIRADVRFDPPRPGVPTKMVLAVSDRDGNVLGLFRMKDATVFSIDVAVAKSRNMAYYADPTAIQNDDLVDDDLLVARGVVTPAQLAAAKAKINGVNNHQPDLFTSPTSSTRYNPLTGLALTNRTFRFLAEPRYPSGIDGLAPIFSTMNTIGVNSKTAENLLPGIAGRPLASNFNSVLGFDAFHAGRNFHDPSNIKNQNGIVFFPGSTALYLGGGLQGGFGVSGDGVDQDDVVTSAGAVGFTAPQNLRADMTFYRGVRLPYQKFNRNPRL